MVSMHLEVQIHEIGSHISIKAEGLYSLADLRKLLDRVKVESDKRAVRGVILDITGVVGTIPIMDMHALGEYCSGVWKLALRVAIVSPEGGLDKFFENVARNRGVQIVVVPTPSAAIEWIGCG